MNLRLTLSAILVFVCIIAFASGAPWYRWKNKVDGTIICAQNSPGEAWDIDRGPYMESTCRKPGNPQ